MKNKYHHYQHPSDGKTAEDKALDRFAELMIEKIKHIHGDWQQPWFTEGLPWPRNIYDGKRYDGLNAFMLNLYCDEKGYRLPVFGTFERFLSYNYKTDSNGQKSQLTDAEGNPLPRVSVNKGEQSFPLYFTSYTVVDPETKEKLSWEEYKKLSKEEQARYRIYPKRQVWPVFCVEQTNLKEARPEIYRKLEADVIVKKPEHLPGEMYSFPAIDSMIAEGTWLCPIRLDQTGVTAGAFFHPGEDAIHLPPKETFFKGESFYGTTIHEMVHSTGTKERLDRLEAAPFGSPAYAREELVAEMGAALVCQEFGIEKSVDAEHTQYIKSWLSSLEAEPEYIKTVLGDVKKATSMVAKRIEQVQELIGKKQSKDEEEKRGSSQELQKPELKAAGNSSVKSENPDESWYERYDTVSKFIDGLAVVSKGDKWGFINPEGQEVVPCQYQEVCKFSEGLAAVQNDGMYGYTDKSGHEVIPCQYDYAYPFSEGLAIIEKSGQRGFIDPTGTEVIPCQYDNAEDFSGGYACVEQDGKWGYIDQQGKEIIPCQYISPSSAALALEKRKQEQVSSNCCDRYTKTMKLPDGSAIVKNNNLFGYVDSSGHEVIPCQYDYVGEFSEGLAVVEKDRKYGCVDTFGNEVVPCQYDYVADFSEGLAVVLKGDKCGFIDPTGTEAIPCQYDNAYPFSEGFATVKKDGKWGYIDAAGTEVIPCQYDYACEFSEGLAAVKQDHKWGFINRQGETVIRPQYTLANEFSEGLAVVNQGGPFGVWGVIDKNGHQVVPLRYTREIESFKDGCAVMENDSGDKFYFDRTGKIYDHREDIAPDILPYDIVPAAPEAMTLKLFSEGSASECLRFAGSNDIYSSNGFVYSDLGALAVALHQELAKQPRIIVPEYRINVQEPHVKIAPDPANEGKYIVSVYQDKTMVARESAVTLFAAAERILPFRSVAPVSRTDADTTVRGCFIRDGEMLKDLTPLAVRISSARNDEQSEVSLHLSSPDQKDVNVSVSQDTPSSYRVSIASAGQKPEVTCGLSRFETLTTMYDLIQQASGARPGIREQNDAIIDAAARQNVEGQQAADQDKELTGQNRSCHR